MFLLASLFFQWRRNHGCARCWCTPIAISELRYWYRLLVCRSSLNGCLYLHICAFLPRKNWLALSDSVGHIDINEREWVYCKQCVYMTTHSHTSHTNSHVATFKYHNMVIGWNAPALWVTLHYLFFVGRCGSLIVYALSSIHGLYGCSCNEPLVHPYKKTSSYATVFKWVTAPQVKRKLWQVDRSACPTHKLTNYHVKTIKTMWKIKLNLTPC